jgi:ribonucleotide monophosphatase NagD (HAD superfamily)
MIRTRISRAFDLRPWRLLALAVAVAALYCSTLRAETIAVDEQVAVRDSDINRPGRGMTMKTVEEKFGSPEERHPAVGKPAISRWDYPTFSVFFENEFVIHAVVNAGS